MTTAEELAWADPTDLYGLRGALSAADPEGRLAPIAMSRIEIGPEALYLLPEIVSELVREARTGDLAAPRVALVVDATPMRRGGSDLKKEAERLLGGHFEVRRAVIGGEGTELHADEEALAEAEAAVAGADCVVVVGSGTITDVCKEATRRAGGSPLVVVQTAASVNAFSDDMAVLLKSGTKRTVPSRWPDALLVDLTVLAEAPPEMNLAGFGDLMAMWTAPADWYLAQAVGMDDSYHPAPVDMLREQGRGLLAGAAGLRRREPEMLDRLARVLTLSGISLGVAGKTAPLSGTEHLVSHLIDMAAEGRHRPVGPPRRPGRGRRRPRGRRVGGVPRGVRSLAGRRRPPLPRRRQPGTGGTAGIRRHRPLGAGRGRMLERLPPQARAMEGSSAAGGRFPRGMAAAQVGAGPDGRRAGGLGRRPQGGRRPGAFRRARSPGLAGDGPLGLEELPPHARPLHRGRPALLRRSVGRRLRRADPGPRAFRGRGAVRAPDKIFAGYVFDLDGTFDAVARSEKVRGE